MKVSNISVFILSRNRPEYLNELLLSLEGADLTKVEKIVVSENSDISLKKKFMM